MNTLIIQICISLIVIFPILAQEDEEDDRPCFILECDARDEKGKPMSGVGRSIYSSDSLINYSVSDSLGVFEELYFFYNYEFFIYFTKEKYVQKSIYINAELRNETDSVSELITFPMDVTMLKAKKRKDYSIITDKPLLVIIINKETGRLGYDKAYIARRKEEIDAFYGNKR